MQKRLSENSNSIAVYYDVLRVGENKKLIVIFSEQMNEVK